MDAVYLPEYQLQILVLINHSISHHFHPMISQLPAWEFWELPSHVPRVPPTLLSGPRQSLVAPCFPRRLVSQDSLPPRINFPGIVNPSILSLMAPIAQVNHPLNLFPYAVILNPFLVPSPIISPGSRSISLGPWIASVLQVAAACSRQSEERPLWSAGATNWSFPLRQTHTLARVQVL